jgi:hypothetical protein
VFRLCFIVCLKGTKTTLLISYEGKNYGIV